MPFAFDHGPRLTQPEYEKAVVELYSTAGMRQGVGTEQNLGRRELDLMIDFRLGINFPQNRRDQLWIVQRKVEHSRLRLAASSLALFLKPRLLHTRTNRVAKFVVDEYAKVLTKSELEAYFGEDEIQRPTLPLEG